MAPLQIQWQGAEGHVFSERDIPVTRNLARQSYRLTRTAGPEAWTTRPRFKSIPRNDLLWLRFLYFLGGEGSDRVRLRPDRVRLSRLRKNRVRWHQQSSKFKFFILTKEKYGSVTCASLAYVKERHPKVTQILGHFKLSGLGHLQAARRCAWLP